MVAWRNRRVVPLVVALFCLSVPAAGQTGYALTLDDPVVAGAPIVPDVDVGTIDVPWSLTCEGPAAPTVTSTATMRWNVSAPEEVLVTGRLMETVERPDCALRPAVEGVARFQVEATQRAQAFTEHRVIFEATLLPDGPSPVPGEQNVTATTVAPVEVQFVGRYAANLPRSILQNGPGSTSKVEVELENVGNAPTVPRFVVDGNVSGLSIPAPDVLAPGSAGTYVLRYKHPDGFGYDNKERVLRVAITPVAVAHEASEGEPSVINLLFRTQSFGSSQDAPAPPFTFVIAAFVGVTMLARRARP